MSELTPKDRRLHAAFRDLVGEAGGVEASGSVVTLGKSQMGRMYVDPPEAWASIRVVGRLESFVGVPIVTRVAAGMLGYDLVRSGENQHPAGCLHSSTGKVMSEALDVARTYAELVADGLSPADAAAMDLVLRDLAREVEKARHACAAIRARAVDLRSVS